MPDLDRKGIVHSKTEHHKLYELYKFSTNKNERFFFYFKLCSMINGSTQRGKMRTLLRVSCLLTALLLGTFLGYAQEGTVKVTGKVVDESNMPIPGA